MRDILLIGINHKTAPVELRECMAFSKDESSTAVDTLRRTAAIHEALPTMSTMRDAGAVDALRAAAPAEELRRLSEATTAPRLASLLRLAADAPIHG